MNEPWAFGISELLFGSLLTTSPTPHHYRVTVRTARSQQFCGITTHANHPCRFTSYISTPLLIKVSLDTPLITPSFTALGHQILRWSLAQILPINTPTLHHRITTRSPPP